MWNIFRINMANVVNWPINIANMIQLKNFAATVFKHFEKNSIFRRKILNNG